MTNDSDTENNRKADDVVELLLDLDKLKNVIPNDQERKRQFAPILKKIVLSKDKAEIKENIRELMENLNRFGVTFHDDSLYEDESIVRAPILWSNAKNFGLLNRDRYNPNTYYYYYSNNKVMMVLWNIIGNAVKIQDKIEINGTYCREMFELGRIIRADPISHIPYDRLLSEIWVETMPLDDILNKELVIEFGQNSPLFNENGVFFATDSVMSVSELPILLDRIAKHNLDIDLGIAVGEKIYLEKTGISKKQIKDGTQEDIKDDINRGFIVVKKVKRDLGGNISKEYIRVPIELRYLILKLEKRRLKKIITKLEKSEEVITEENILTEAVKENSNIQNSFDNEEQQHNFIERARQKQEINYLMSEYFVKNRDEIQEEDENPLKTLLNEKRNILKTTKAERNETFKNLLAKEKEVSKKSLFTKLWDSIGRWTKKYTQKYEFLRNLVKRLENLVNKLNFSSNCKNERLNKALIDKLKKLNGTNEELLKKGTEEFTLLSTNAKKEVLDKLKESNKEIGGKTRIITDVNEVRV